MAVGLKEPAGLLPVEGVRLSACSAGIYQNKRLDFALLAFEQDASCAAMFTQNAFCAAPVLIAKQHLGKTSPKFCLINAGNANAGTGEQGYQDAIDVCHDLAAIAHCPVESILPFSTGVIGEYLPTDKLCAALPGLYNNLADDNWLDVGRAIMTTDTLVKGISKKINIDKQPVTITGIAKGAGMIRPDMATMLAFIATDVKVERGFVEQILRSAVEKSFNRICVDGDTSTNDACVLIATGKSKASVPADLNSEAAIQLIDAITHVCAELAQAIIRDGEGASKFITVEVNGGKSTEECLTVAYTIANSPLIKTAFFGSDPNWGRILAAVGRSGLVDLTVADVSIYLDDVCIVENGVRAKDYLESAGQAVMSGHDILLRVSLGRGKVSESIWTCDLSHDYVTINAEYRT
ncbi:MAG: bifunctional glutamate N-acetyltransferase/amino-acid acetyltransferase ArgJ [Proteobacteria bacterium]|nr:bifunctional glutamate N-acetyltransferase/amino-acid acetyltransferase ArgJ [Pseudomonadota bacterium]